LGNQILDYCKLKSGDLDVLDGSPPCQGFSINGKRDVNDTRNELYKEYIRLINELKPKVFVMENVSGMIKGKYKGKFKQIMNELSRLFYNIKCKMMNAVNYGVPQSRERLIWIGIRNDLNYEPVFPLQNNKKITVGDAFKDINNDGQEIKLLPKWLRKATKDMIAGNYSTEHMEKALLKYSGKISGFMNTKLLAYNRYSCTLTKTEMMHGGIIHPDCERYLTLMEYKRLSTFPDDFIFTSRKEGIARIGNSVPPKLMYEIAKCIKSNILKNTI
jgi:DNA (cytosine-5)-methyltransferase 1